MPNTWYEELPKKNLITITNKLPSICVISEGIVKLNSRIKF